MSGSFKPTLKLPLLGFTEISLGAVLSFFAIACAQENN
jgi:hypothetical protein